MSIDLAALKTEIANDPKGLGYAAAIASSANADVQNDAVATILNRSRQTETKNRDSVTSGELAASIVRSEFAALSAGDKQYLQILMGAGTMPLTASLKTELGAIFPGTSATRAALVSLGSAAASRAIVLFGETVNRWDVARARAL